VASRATTSQNAASKLQPTRAPNSRTATMRWLETTALNAMTCGQGEHEPREERLGTTRGSLSTFLLSRSWRYRLAELRLHLSNQTDVLTVPRSERLWFLYPVLRLPLWIRRHAAKLGTAMDKETSRKADR
jgi:hypothetical protein